MLVLTRLEGQRILIGENIVIEVCDIKGDRVRLGVTCPREIEVDRSEVRDAKRAEQKQ
jgi:carbon storage regulator